VANESYSEQNSSALDFTEIVIAQIYLQFLYVNKRNFIADVLQMYRVSPLVILSTTFVALQTIGFASIAFASVLYLQHRISIAL